MATENWWGSHTGPTHASNPGGTGDPVSNYVDFSGFAAVSPMPLPDPLPPAGTPPTWTTVSSNITANTTWYAASSPYIVTADIAVNAGIKLTIQPGVVVKFAAAKKLTVNGILSAVGNAGAAHHLHLDQGRPRRATPTATARPAHPKPGDWGGIIFADSSVDAPDQAPVRHGALRGERRLRRADRRRVAGHQRQPDQRQQRLRPAGAQLSPRRRSAATGSWTTAGAGSSWRPPRRRR